MKINDSLLSIRFSYISMLLSIALLIVLSTTAEAKKSESSTSGAIDAKTFEILTKAQELTEQEQYDEALEVLDTIKESGKLNGYTKSQMWNFYAYIYANQERYKDAIDAYQQIIAEPDAPDGLKLTAKYTLAQLYFQLEDYIAVIELMEEWLKTAVKPTSTAHIILVQCYYQTEQYELALKNIEHAIALEQAAGKPLKENWLQLKAAIYFAQDDTKNMLATYLELFHAFPKPNYLKQIAGLYGELENDVKRLATYDALYTRGGLTQESEILNLAYMYLGQGIPYKAGTIIEQHIQRGVIKDTPKNAEMLANAWAQANEHRKAIPALENAAQKSGKGILYARLAGVHFDNGDFKSAAEAAKLAEQKGGLKRADNNHILMGMALFNIKDFSAALQSFRQAKGSKKTFSAARKWEKYTLAEIKRIAALKASEFKLAQQTATTLEAGENNLEAIGRNMLKQKAAEQ